MDLVTDRRLVRDLQECAQLSDEETQAFNLWSEQLEELLHRQRSEGPILGKGLSSGWRVFNACCSPGGLLGGLFKQRSITTYIDKMPDLEARAAVNKSEVKRKFYRDHIDHMIRVFLLASYLAKTMNGKVSSRSLALTCLFHDVTQLVDISKELSTSKEDNDRFVHDMASIAATSICANYREMKEYFSRRLESTSEHDVAGAFLTWRTLKVEHKKQSLDALLAIALHHAEPGLLSRMKIAGCPELCFLILADELQEWNRRAFLGGVYQTFTGSSLEIEVAKRKRLQVQARIAYGAAELLERAKLVALSPDPVFSPLKQIGAKFEGFERLSKADFDISIVQIVGVYKRRGYKRIDDVLPDSKGKCEGTCWHAFYVDQQDFPDEILKLTSANRASLSKLPRGFTTVTITLAGGKAHRYLGQQELAEDVQWDASDGYRKVMCALSEHLERGLLGDQAWEIRQAAALGYISIVVPGCMSELGRIRNEPSCAYELQLAQVAEECGQRLREQRKGSIDVETLDFACRQLDNIDRESKGHLRTASS